jgi:hypothetical protein
MARVTAVVAAPNPHWRLAPPRQRGAKLAGGLTDAPHVVRPHPNEMFLRGRQPLECRIGIGVAAHAGHERGIHRHVGRRGHDRDGPAHRLVETAVGMALRHPRVDESRTQRRERASCGGGVHRGHRRDERRVARRRHGIEAGDATRAGHRESLRGPEHGQIPRRRLAPGEPVDRRDERTEEVVGRQPFQQLGVRAERCEELTHIRVHLAERRQRCGDGRGVGERRRRHGGRRGRRRGRVAGALARHRIPDAGTRDERREHADLYDPSPWGGRSGGRHLCRVSTPGVERKIVERCHGRLLS